MIIAIKSFAGRAFMYNSQPMKNWTLILIALLFCSVNINAEEEIHSTVWDPIVTTSDGHQLRCTYHQPQIDEINVDANAVILVHMLGGKKTDWNKLPEKLSKKGFAVLVLELRGHSDTLAKADNWTSYEKKDFNKMTKDIIAGKEWLKKRKKVHIKKVACVGAQLGANLCLLAMKEDKELLASYCLSPGESYREVKVDYKLEGIKDRPLMLVTTEEDTYGAPCLAEFKKQASVKTELLKFEKGHKKAVGTGILTSREGTEEKIVDWLGKNF